MESLILVSILKIILILLLFKSNSLIKGNLVKKFLLICIVITVSELFILSNIQWALPGFNIQNLLPSAAWYKNEPPYTSF